MLDLIPPHAAAPLLQDHRLLAVARVTMSLLFIHSGYGKVAGFAAFTEYLSGMGVPAPAFFAVAAVLVELGAGIFLAFGYRTRWAAWILAGFTVVATVIGHPFWEGGPGADANLLHALKNTSILGGLLALSMAHAAVDRLRRA